MRTLSANWSGAQWFAAPVPSMMPSVAEHGGLVEPWENKMKKIAFRVMTVGGGLIAVLLAGGAWGRG
jgi:hypothetical protein